MGEIHSQGKIYPTRLGQENVLHSVPVNFNDTGVASGILCLTVDALEKPTVVEVQVIVTTAFNAGTTNVLLVGTTAGGNDILAASDITEATPGFYPSNGGAKQILVTVDTPIYVTYTYTGTAPTTGQAFIVINVFGLETIPATAT